MFLSQPPLLRARSPVVRIQQSKESLINLGSDNLATRFHVCDRSTRQRATTGSKPSTGDLRYGERESAHARCLFGYQQVADALGLISDTGRHYQASPGSAGHELETLPGHSSAWRSSETSHVQVVLRGNFISCELYTAVPRDHVIKAPFSDLCDQV
ncbi:hypothetical protein BaRGS_00003285 [Batillaria attramentaria]|uniref:Uncharacterized protein n=1 Tax=Batillaria attramentaria TaxID=370345 RepID=A0ABD0M170_9CAEN